MNYLERLFLGLLLATCLWVVLVIGSRVLGYFFSDIFLGIAGVTALAATAFLLSISRGSK